MRPVTWGVLGTAKIALERVLPAMAASPLCEVHAIASRDPAAARAVARATGIAVVHDSYDALLNDPEIEAVYVPLPNHLHAPWTRKAIEHGKHVLCEKPIALNAAEAEALIAVRDAAGVVVEEAFMVRHHPQWRRVRDLIWAGRIGRVGLVRIALTYVQVDPNNIRNHLVSGGGAMYDVGCYGVALARFLFEAEPLRVFAAVRRDDDLGVDVLSSAIVEFEAGQAVFSVSTRLARYQSTQIVGTGGWIELDVTTTAPTVGTSRIWVSPGRIAGRSDAVVEAVPAANQYRLQAEAFARAVRGVDMSSYPLEDAVANMRVLDALFSSERYGAWVDV